MNLKNKQCYKITKRIYNFLKDNKDNPFCEVIRKDKDDEISIGLDLGGGSSICVPLIFKDYKDTEFIKCGQILKISDILENCEVVDE